MNVIFRVLSLISYEVWATVGFTCKMLGMPDGPVRKAVEYVACLGLTTLFDTAFFACSLGACFAVPTLLFGNAQVALHLWLFMFSPPALELFGAFALITTLLVMNNTSQQHDA